MKFICMILSFAIFNSFGYDPAAYSNPNRHVCSMAISNQIYNPAGFFNNNLRYTIDENIGSVRVSIDNDDGTTRNINVDVAPLVRNAADMWNQRLIARGSPIRLTEVPQGLSGQTDFQISRVNSAQQDRLDENFAAAYTMEVLPTDILEHYILPEFNRPGMYLANTFSYDRDTFNTVRRTLNEHYTESHAAKIVVYQVIIHEFGHALGLTHPGSLDLESEKEKQMGIDTSNPRNFLAVAMTAALEQGQPDARVPVMTDDDHYFFRLRQQLGRRLNYDDIAASELELIAIDMENACGGLTSFRSKRNVVFSASCKEKPRIFYPITQSLIPIYQTLLF
ncbi:matrixin family metalloprotease [Xenorhabdus sp. XENO-1]|uniref:matrixin family metalloprotease n=1 Tax=Xenorhabdus bovienii TaxID=40576 RepID=UPI0020CA5782|nr:matrixin family metalloprotease [Xenorhabdus bovienii]MCP9269951.1 matrixin family metalloprotease [Xenorhabdus bovienii subsp. africana]